MLFITIHLILKILIIIIIITIQMNYINIHTRIAITIGIECIE